MKKAYLTLDPPREPDGTLCRTGLRRSAPVVLLPGDPQRSRKMAALFAEASFTAHRGTFATYTGKTPGGADIAVTSSGMGCACVAAALEELAAAGAEAVIRVGTCGGVQPDLAPGTIVIASGCVRGEGASYELVPPEFPAVADPLLVRALCSAAQELDEPVRVGLYRSHDAFYMESKAAHPGLRERMQKWIDTGVLVVENESGLLFTYGHLLGLRAASICVALGSMFADPNANVYGAYADPEHLARRIETATRIAMRAAETTKNAYANVLQADDYAEQADFENDGTITKLSVATTGGEQTGYVAETTFSGAQGMITMVVGLDSDYNCTGVYITKHSETSGLGAKAADTTDGAWRDNLVGQGDGLALTKDKGTVAAISGATITSRAVVTEVQTVINAAKSLG